jgi:hypothetical protein
MLVDAVHVDHDDFIMFDTPSERVMCRFVTCATDIRTFPIDNRRDGIGFISTSMSAASTGATTPMPRVRFMSASRRATCSITTPGRPACSR